MFVTPDCDIANITMVDTFEKAVYRQLEEVGLPNLKKDGIIFRYKNDILVLSDSFLIVKMEDRDFDFVGLPRFSEQPETDIRYQITITHTGKPRHLTKDWEGSNVAETSKVIKIGGNKEATVDGEVINETGTDKDIIRQLAPSVEKQTKQNNQRTFPSSTPEPGTTRSGYERIFDMDSSDPWAATRELTGEEEQTQPQSISNYNNTNSKASKFGELDFSNVIRDDKVDPKVAIALKVIQGTAKDSQSLRVLEQIKDKLTDLSYDGQNIFISLKGDDNLIKIGLLKSGKFRFTSDDWEHLKEYEKFK